MTFTRKDTVTVRATVIFYLCLEVILFAVSLFHLLRGYFFCRDSCGPPYILLNKKQRIRMKKDYYSDNDLRFPCWTVAHSFQNVNFANAMFDSEFYRRKIIKNLRTLLRKWVEIRQVLKIIFLAKFIGTNRLFGKVRGLVTSVKSRGVLNHPQSFVCLFLFLFCIS